MNALRSGPYFLSLFQFHTNNFTFPRQTAGDSKFNIVYPTTLLLGQIVNDCPDEVFPPRLDHSSITIATLGQGGPAEYRQAD